MSYVVMGKGETLVFFPGGFCSASYYEKLIELLVDDYQVIVPDVPGFGGSNLPDDMWDYYDYGDFFSGFLDDLSLTNVSVMGHSFGGGVGIALATKTDRVAKLILVDSSGVEFEGGILKFAFQVFIAKSFRDMFRYQDRKLMLKIGVGFVVWILGHLSRLPKTARVTHVCLRQTIDKIDEIQAETIIVWGKDDKIFPVDMARKLKNGIVNSRLIWVDGNHDWIFFEPRLMADLVRDYL